MLKTQDENYIRTMRAAGLKVCCLSMNSIVLPDFTSCQKIDKLKTQLTGLADLVRPSAFEDENANFNVGEDCLDETEVEILRKAGVISNSRPKGRSKKSQHIVFVDNEEEGAPRSTICMID